MNRLDSPDRTRRLRPLEGSMPVFSYHQSVVATVAVAVLALAACGDNGANISEPGTIEVELSDFRFEDLPRSVEAGTQIAISNTSATELHELVAFRLDDGDDRTVDDVLADPAALLASEPTLVLIAAPGSDEHVVAVGDGALAEPGRYLIACFIPTGADPDEYLAAAATSEGPPDVPGGPPHIAHGMFAEILVN